MPKTTDSVIFSQTEREILELVLQKPDLSNAEVADRTGYRIAFVRDTRSEYEDDVELADDATVETTTTDDSVDTEADGTELSELQVAILETVRNNPTMSNGEIADRTGARVALVRDTRDQYEDALDIPDTDEPEDRESDIAETTDDTSLTDAQVAILELAANNSELTNAEIAEQTGTRITFVRDTRAEYEGDVEVADTATAETDTGDDDIERTVDDAELSKLQIAILEAVRNNPTISNAEVADKTGARIALVRDTRDQYEDALDVPATDDEPDNDELDDHTSEVDSGSDTVEIIDDTEYTDVQAAILELAANNPELTNAEIAEKVGTRTALVRDTRAKYEDDVEVADTATAETDTGDDDIERTVDDAELSELQIAILEAVRNNPTISNAEIADKTGTRVALVRDTRDQYEDALDVPDTDDEPNSDELDSHTSEVDSGSDAVETIDDTEYADVQAAILELAANNPELTNAEIAEKIGTRTALVRDTRAQHGNETEAKRTSGSERTNQTDNIDTEAFSKTQQEILKTALNDPELTNAEVAAKTGTRISLVRDTILEHETDSKSTGETKQTDDADVLTEVDTETFSKVQLDILKTALSNPELTNAEIAAQTGTRITLVRDTLFEYEYDETPWGGEIEDDVDDGNDHEDDVTDGDDHEDDIDDGDDHEGDVTDSDDHKDDIADHDTETVDTETGDTGLPETTAADVFSETQREILETSLINPDLTNAEIATKTGSRITLVRDTRETYGTAVELPDDTENSEAAANLGSSISDEPTEKQRAILEAAADNPELTNAEIADQTGARITFVRDTRTQFEGETDFTEAGTATDDTDTAADTDTTADTESTAGAEPEGTKAGLMIAILIGLIVVGIVAASLGVI